MSLCAKYLFYLGLILIHTSCCPHSITFGPSVLGFFLEKGGCTPVCFLSELKRQYIGCKMHGDIHL